MLTEILKTSTLKMILEFPLGNCCHINPCWLGFSTFLTPSGFFLQFCSCIVPCNLTWTLLIRFLIYQIEWQKNTKLSTCQKSYFFGVCNSLLNLFTEISSFKLTKQFLHTFLLHFQQVIPNIQPLRV